jgi:hypothetical protein
MKKKMQEKESDSNKEEGEEEEEEQQSEKIYLLQFYSSPVSLLISKSPFSPLSIPLHLSVHCST